LGSRSALLTSNKGRSGSGRSTVTRSLRTRVSDRSGICQWIARNDTILRFRTYAVTLYIAWQKLRRPL